MVGRLGRERVFLKCFLLEFILKVVGTCRKSIKLLNDGKFSVFTRLFESVLTISKVMVFQRIGKRKTTEQIDSKSPG